MKSTHNRCALVLLTLTAGLFSAFCLKAETLTYTLSGVTTFNQVVQNSPINTEFPVGTKWEMVVSWDTQEAALYYDVTQAQYGLISCILTFKGVSGDWTTAALDGKASFTLNKLANRHEIQFTSGWGPENHTNGTIGDLQPYSANVSLSDSTLTAINSLTPAPTVLRLSDWANTQTNEFKLYMNNAGNLRIVGRVDSIKLAGETIFKTETYDLGSGWWWNAKIGFLYLGFYPFVWLPATSNWIYVYETPDASDASFYLYDFGGQQLGWTGHAYYPQYYVLDGARAGQWATLAPAQ